jgi:bifunctional DNase/RNase
MRIGTVAVVLALACGCRAERAHRLATDFEALAGVMASAEARHAEKDRAHEEQRRIREATRDAPEGYVLVTPVAKSDPAYGNVVMLTDAISQKLVPIFIGGTEGLSIELRLARRKFTRPLTHDLLDEAVGALGAKMVRAQVDGLRDGVYVGTVVLVRGGQTLALDARPSDAIALAIGNDAPIYLSKKLLDQAGIALSELDQAHARPHVAPITL